MPEPTGTSLHVTVLWRHADWGLYGRRHEAIARELARRPEVGSVLHVEPVSVPGAGRLLRRWWSTKRASMKEAYAAQLWKLLVPRPRPVEEGLYTTSVLTLLNRTYPFPVAALNRWLVRTQCSLLQNARRELQGTHTCTLVYPPGMYLPEALHVLDSDVVVADVVDDVLARVGDARRARMYRATYRTVFNAADHAFATSEQVVRRFPDAPCDIEVLPNGVTVPEGEGPKERGTGHEEATGRGTGTAPAGRESRPLAIYAGQLNQALDAEIVESVIEQCPEVTFRFYGPVSDPAGRRVAAALADRSNVDLAGPVPHTELYRRLCQADVLLNFKKPDHTTSGNDLLKIYEYMATGRPIVSPRVSPVGRFEEVIHVADTPGQFVVHLRAALREDAEARAETRVAYARANSWASRVDEVVHILLALRSASTVRESAQADVPVGGSVKERERGQQL